MSTPGIGLAPPSSLEAEQAVLGSILLRATAMDEVIDIVEPGDFYKQAHGIIYRVMLHLYNQNDPIDLVTVTFRLKEADWLSEVGGPVFLAELSEQVGTAANARYYAGLVKKYSVVRQLLEASQAISQDCMAFVESDEGLLNKAEERIHRIRDTSETTVAHSLSDLVPLEVEHIEELFERKGEVLGVPSGFSDLDHLTGGWQGGDLIILAARPSMGKTALSLNMAHYASESVAPTLFFSLEQPKEQLVQRLLASQGPVHAVRLRTAKMADLEWSTMTEAAAHLMEVPLFIVDKPAMTVQEIRSQARRLKARHNIGLIVLDYLQLARDKRRQSREQEVGQISQGLKALAKELNVPVIALSQLNRKVEERPNKRPILADLRESGSIEQDADMVIFIYRDEVYNEKSNDVGVAEIRVAKHRNGPTGKIKLTWLREYMKFANMAPDLFGRAF